MGGPFGGEFVVATAQVLHERVPGRDNTQRSDSSSSRASAAVGLEPAVISFYSVVRILLEYVSRGRGEVVDHTRVDRRPVGGDLGRSRALG